jgi:hypothetical protein
VFADSQIATQHRVPATKPARRSHRRPLSLTKYAQCRLIFDVLCQKSEQRRSCRRLAQLNRAPAGKLRSSKLSATEQLPATKHVPATFSPPKNSPLGKLDLIKLAQQVLRRRVHCDGASASAFPDAPRARAYRAITMHASSAAAAAQSFACTRLPARLLMGVYDPKRRLPNRAVSRSARWAGTVFGSCGSISGHTSRYRTLRVGL